MSKIEYQNIIAFHPGSFLSEIIEELEMTQKDFAQRLDITQKNLSDFLNGKAPLTNKIAQNLAAMLGTSVDVWLNLQKQYDEKLIQIEELKLHAEEESYLKYLDYNFFANLGLVTKTRDKFIKIVELKKFLHISHLKILSQDDFLVQFRRGDATSEDTIVNSNAWVQTVLNLGSLQPTESFSKKKLKKAIPALRTMTNSDPNEVIPEIQSILNQCGVAMVVLPSIKKTGVFGACKWLSKEKAVIGLTDRRKLADTFWFSLFHELGHVLQMRTSQSYYQFEKESDCNHETGANDFAKDILLPRIEHEAWLEKGNLSEDSILRYAKKTGVHPGIIVGRLQRDELIRYSQMNELKMRFEIN